MTEWISVEDRLTEEFDFYIISWMFESLTVVGEGSFSQGNQWLVPIYSEDKDVITSAYPEVTHWQPLPEPPTQEE